MKRSQPNLSEVKKLIVCVSWGKKELSKLLHIPLNYVIFTNILKGIITYILGSPAKYNKAHVRLIYVKSLKLRSSSVHLLYESNLKRKSNIDNNRLCSFFFSVFAGSQVVTTIC